MKKMKECCCCDAENGKKIQSRSDTRRHASRRCKDGRERKPTPSARGCLDSKKDFIIFFFGQCLFILINAYRQKEKWTKIFPTITINGHHRHWNHLPRRMILCRHRPCPLPPICLHHLWTNGYGR